MLVLLAIIGTVLFVGVKWYGPVGEPRPPLNAALGLGVGLLGAFVALVLVTDLVPDAIEQGVRPFAVGVITLVAIIGSIYRFAR